MIGIGHKMVNDLRLRVSSPRILADQAQKLRAALQSDKELAGRASDVGIEHQAYPVELGSMGTHIGLRAEQP